MGSYRETDVGTSVAIHLIDYIEVGGSLWTVQPGQGEMEAVMAKDDRDLLELLQEELAFVEQGGYGRSVRTPWREKSVFQDSLTCLNYGYPNRAHACSDCHLIGFVSDDDRNKAIPCHHLSLNESGDTIVDLESYDNQRKLESEVKEWLRAKIKELEDKVRPRPEEIQTLPASSETSYCCKT